MEEPSPERCKEETKTLTTAVEQGVPEGTEAIFARASEQTPGTIPGNVVVKLKSAKHAVFRRERNDLWMELTIPLRAALLGFEHVIHHLDGHAVTIRQAGVTSHGQVLVLANEGMPVHGVPSEFGKLHVKLAIEMPAAITQVERGFLRDHLEPQSGITIGRALS